MNILLWAAPGSGKSFFVKNVLKEPSLEKILPRQAFVEVNAAQMASPIELSAALRRVTSSIAEHGAAAFFLDEADTTLPGTTGTLYPYLLMPMWDGQYLSDGHPLNMKRVVWFFAVSGKASNIQGFETAAKKVAKGEDFISRFHSRISLPALSGRGQLLIFLGSLLRLHKGFDISVERQVLQFIATRKVEGGARAIEKAVMLVRVEKGRPVRLSDIEPLLRVGKDALESVTLDAGTETEAVAIVDL